MTPEAAKEFSMKVGLKMNYSADLPKLNALNCAFTQLCLDEETAHYLGASVRARHGRLLTWLHRSLRGIFSDFDVNGLLGTYPMHVLSARQWGALLGKRGGKLLDIGAGRGDATARLAEHFDEVVVTETSRPMAKRLRKQGYTCIDGDLALGATPLAKFDAVSLLNVLDRCDQPLTLLARARSAVKPGGLLVVALVIPYHPFVYDAGLARAPRERLPITSRDFEIAAVQFVSLALWPLGLEVVTVSRAPYLSGGDAEKPLYELDDLIVVCRAVGELPLIGG